MDVHVDPAEHVTIRVSTPDPSGQPIAVRASVYGSGTAAVELIDGFTPLEVAARGHVLSGMVQAVDSATQVMVDVFTTTKDADPKLLMRARTHCAARSQFDARSGAFYPWGSVMSPDHRAPGGNLTNAEADEDLLNCLRQRANSYLIPLQLR